MARITIQDVDTAIWLAEYVGLNGNGFLPSEEVRTAQMAVDLADAYCYTGDYRADLGDHREAWERAYSALETAASIAQRVRERQLA